MTTLAAPRPEDVYDSATIAEFRSAGHWRDEVLTATLDRLATSEPDRVVVSDGYGELTARGLRAQA